MTAIFTLWQEQPPIFIATVALFSLLVGSFLNVVIYRLPLMLEAGWREECQQFLGLGTDSEQTPKPRFDLLFPGSQCPHCRHPIAAYENIPVLSYLLLKGRCSACKTPISPRYPIIEALTALLSALVAWRLGPSWPCGFALLLSWSLVALSVIDIDRHLLPDNIVLPLVWVGLFLSLFGVFSDSHASILGAMAGYLSLWTVFQLFRLLTGKEGMGYGDFKLLAAFGAWFGWQSLLLIVLLSSLVGTLAGVALILSGRQDRSKPIPFGPYLSMAGWIAMLWGHDITQAYLRFVGIPQ